MSAVEHDTERGSRSSFTITLNSKREAQVIAKIYVGDTVDEVEAARRLAVSTFYATLSDCGIGGTAV